MMAVAAGQKSEADVDALVAFVWRSRLSNTDISVICAPS
jgi:hypothetical protein